MAGGWPAEPEWLDAQPLLERVCGGMAAGELLHGPSFSLFESTTAIEIGDPKMDIGLHRAQETRSAEELIAGGAAPVVLPPPQLLAVMDQLLCLEATWHTGSMMPQTVFASLYMLQPDRLASNPPLHAFCLALRSACSLFVDMAHAGSVTEDEDFFVHTFGIRMLDLPGPKPVAAALQALATAEEQLEQSVAGGSSSSSSSSSSAVTGTVNGSGRGLKKQQQQQQQQQRGPTGSSSAADAGEADGAASSVGRAAQLAAPSSEQAAALLARIRFRRLLLQALQSLQLYSQAGVAAAQQQCRLAEAQLALVAASTKLAAPLDAAPGFAADVNRRHMGLVPPRPVELVSLGQAVQHWQGLLRGLAEVLAALPAVRGSWPALKACLVHLASSNHHAIVRSALHLQLIKPLPPAPPLPPPGAPVLPPHVGCGSGGGKAVAKRIAAEVPPWCPCQHMVCREFGVTLASVPGPTAALFIEQAAIAIQGQAYALCLNRCRQRRRLRRQLEDWKNIFDHGYNADVSPEMQAWLAAAGWRWPDEEQEGLLQGQGPAAAWAEREAAGCALLHLQLGFPLDLYAPCEYLPMYWYCNYLLECQYRLGRMLHGFAPQPQPQPQPRSRGGRGGSLGKSRGHSGGGGVGAGGQMSASEQVVAAREVELVVLEVERLMSQGMFRAAIALQQLGLIAAPATLFNSEEQRYEQRFAFLEQLCRPEALPFSSFLSSTDVGDVPAVRVLSVVVATFQRAAERVGGLLAAAPLKALLRGEQVRHLEGIQRTASQNAVAAKLLAATSAQAAPRGGTAAPDGAAGKVQKAVSFKVHFDFKAALGSSVATFYPALVLKH